MFNFFTNMLNLLYKSKSCGIVTKPLRNLYESARFGARDLQFNRLTCRYYFTHIWEYKSMPVCFYYLYLKHLCSRSTFRNFPNRIHSASMPSLKYAKMGVLYQDRQLLALHIFFVTWYEHQRICTSLLNAFQVCKNVA
jgi:hypothetical protein